MTAARFDVAARHCSDVVFIAARGDIDPVTGPHFFRVIAAAIDSGSRCVVLNLGGVEFVSVGGLRIVAEAGARLAANGGQMILRSPSPMVRRMIDITGLAAAIEVEEPLVPAECGAGQATAGPALSNHESGAAPRVTAAPAGTDVVDTALRLVVALAVATVEGADDVSVSLRRRGRLATVATSDETILSLDSIQYLHGDGPCVDASVEGRRSHAAQLDHEDRWPAFTPSAIDLGIKAILSTPLLARGRPVGALNMYSNSVNAFARREQEMAATFARHASQILIGAGVVAPDGDISARVAVALRARELIAHTHGILMDRWALSAEDAYTALRRASVKQGLSLVSWAAEVVASTRGQTGPGT